MKRSICLFLCLMMASSILPANALALDLGAASAVGSEAVVTELVAEVPAEEPVVEETAETAAQDGATSGICGDNLTWTLENGILTISGTGAMEDYSYGATLPWSDCVRQINSVVIGEGVTSIGSYAFYNINAIQSVSISSSVTEIAGDAFEACHGLTEFIVNDNNGVFASDVEGVLYSADMKSLIEYPNGKTGAYVVPSGVTTIGYDSFSLCLDLDLVLPRGLTTIEGWAFNYSGLKSIIIPDTVTSIGECAFQGCDQLTDVTIPARVSELYSTTFNACANLENIHVAEENQHYTSLDGVLYTKDMTQLMTVPSQKSGDFIIPDGVEIILNGAFTENELTSLTIPTSVRLIHAFALCPVPDVYYLGTQAQWESIERIIFMEDPLDESTIHFVEGLKAPVVNLSCVAASGKPRLTWDAQSSAVKYEVWRATSKNGTYYRQGTTTGTGYTNTGAVAGKTYYYKVRAVDANGEYSEYSTVKNITCDYAQPTVSISTNTSTGKPKLSWNAVSGATKYEIWRATSRTGTYTKIYTTSNTYFNNTAAVANKSYYYKVRAIGSSSYATSAYSSMVSITCDCAKPVVSVSCNASTGKPKLTWNAVAGATKYEIYRATSKNGTYSKIYTTSNTYFNNTTAEANKSYYYKVRAIGSSSYATSAYSSMVSITCDCARPTVSIARNSNGKPKLTWSAVDGATKYEIWRATSSGGTYTKIYTTSNTYFNNTSAVAGKTYYYKVRAIGSSSYATSAYSTVRSITCK